MQDRLQGWQGRVESEQSSVFTSCTVLTSPAQCQPLSACVPRSNSRPGRGALDTPSGGDEKMADALGRRWGNCSQGVEGGFLLNGGRYQLWGAPRISLLETHPP